MRENVAGFVLSRLEGNVGCFTLNDPDRLNPVTFDRIREITQAAADMSARDDVHVLVVTGAGRAFCAGADLAAEGTFLNAVTPPASGSMVDAPGLWSLTAVRQPVIAMINGPAVGYGFELALQADIRIAGSSARLGHPAVKLGTITDTDTGAATWLLPRLVGWAVAAEVLYSGALYRAEEALAMRLVNHVAKDEDLLDVTTQMAKTMAANSAWALRTTKGLLFHGLQESARANILEQFIKVNQGDPNYDPSPHLARFKK